MTRKDYVLIAAIFKDTLATLPAGRNTSAADYHEHLTCALAFELGRDNPRFDRERFLKAAGVQP